MKSSGEFPDSVLLVLEHEFKLRRPVELAIANKRLKDDPELPAIEARIAELMSMTAWDRAGVAGEIKHQQKERERKRQEFPPVSE